MNCTPNKNQKLNFCCFCTETIWIKLPFPRQRIWTHFHLLFSLFFYLNQTFCHTIAFNAYERFMLSDVKKNEVLNAKGTWFSLYLLRSFKEVTSTERDLYCKWTLLMSPNEWLFGFVSVFFQIQNRTTNCIIYYMYLLSRIVSVASECHVILK